MNLARFSALIGPVLLLTACATPPLPPAPPVSSVEQTEKTAIEEPTPIPERPFPIETFYALLVAEVAGSREQYNIALGNYMQQAEITRDPDIAARATRIARFLNARKSALKAAQLWAEISPDDAEAQFTATSELLRNGQLLAAAQHCRALLNMGSATLYQSIASRADRADTATQQQLADELRLRLQEHPTNTDLMTALGITLQAMGEQQEALQFARAAQEQDPSLVSAVVLEARLLHETGHHQQALKKLADLIVLQPDNSRLRLQYARMLAGTDLQEAERQFSILLQQNPDDDDLIFSLGLISYQQGNNDEAKDYLSRLADDSRHASVSHYYMGRIAEAEEDWQSALENYLRVTGGPNFMTALLRSSEILVRAGETEVAGKRLAELRQRFPEDGERLYLMEAEILTKYDQLENAVILLDTALTDYPESSQLLYSRAMLHEQLDQLDQLEADLRQILQSDPNNANALNALGYTLANRTERYEEAEQLIAKALQLKPGDAAILDSMGWVKYRLGELEEAAIFLQQAMAAMPDHEIAAHLGEVLWALKENQQALEVWTRGLELTPNSTPILNTLERLEITDIPTTPKAD